MSLSSAGMKEAIISALNGKSSAADANKAFGDAILQNICTNAVITYEWAATNPTTGVVDPAIGFTGKLSGGGLLTPSENFESMIIKLSALVRLLTITAPAGFTIPLAFNPAGTLSIKMKGETTQNDAMESFCRELISSFKTSYPAAVTAGTHGAFVGATKGMTIA